MSDERDPDASKVKEGEADPKAPTRPVDNATQEAQNRPRRDRLSEIDKNIPPFR